MESEVRNAIIRNIFITIISVFLIIQFKGSLPYKNIDGPLFILSLVLICYVLQVTNVLQYDRSLIKSGEGWRCITSSLVHGSLVHLFFNINGIILLWILFGEHFNFRSYILLFL